MTDNHRSFSHNGYWTPSRQARRHRRSKFPSRRQRWNHLHFAVQNTKWNCVSIWTKISACFSFQSSKKATKWKDILDDDMDRLQVREFMFLVVVPGRIGGRIEKQVWTPPLGTVHWFNSWTNSSIRLVIRPRCGEAFKEFDIGLFWWIENILKLKLPSCVCSTSWSFPVRGLCKWEQFTKEDHKCECCFVFSGTREKGKGAGEWHWRNRTEDAIVNTETEEAEVQVKTERAFPIQLTVCIFLLPLSFWIGSRLLKLRTLFVRE